MLSRTHRLFCRNFIQNPALLLFGLIASGTAFAADTSQEVRPSHLLNIETAGTLNANTAVLSMFGTNGGRAAYGVANNFEMRLDYNWNTLINTGTTYNLGLTGKYHIWGNDSFGVAVQGLVANGRAALTGQSVNTFTGRVPLTAKFHSVLVTAVGVISKTAISGSSTLYGGEFGVAVPVTSFADAIAEYTIYGQNSTTNLGWDAGVAFKPANRVTIPLVIAQGTGGSGNGVVTHTANVGVLNYLAHVGFEL